MTILATPTTTAVEHTAVMVTVSTTHHTNPGGAQAAYQDRLRALIADGIEYAADDAALTLSWVERGIDATTRVTIVYGT